MPRPEEFTAADGFPLWDTVEVVFFFICGVTAGIALGFFFPSLWRSFRRVFRRLGGHRADLIKLDLLPLGHKVLPDEILTPDDGESRVLPTQLEDSFVRARAWVQVGRLREAVALYTDILRSLQISSRATVRVFHELSQVYAQLGMASKALDMAWEAFSRRPYLEQLLSHYLSLCQHFRNFSRVQEAQNAYRGSLNSGLCFQLAHGLCAAGELTEGEKILVYARQAQHWQKDSLRVHSLLWWAPCFTAQNAVQRWDLWLQGALGWCHWLLEMGAAGGFVYGLQTPSHFWDTLGPPPPTFDLLVTWDREGVGQEPVGHLLAHLLLHTVWRQPQLKGPLGPWAHRWGPWGPWLTAEGVPSALVAQRMGWCTCSSCGTVGQNPEWQCHRCGTWESARVPLISPS